MGKKFMFGIPVVLALVLALVAGLFATSCGTAAPEKEKVIKIHGIGGHTGPVALAIGKYSFGVSDYLKYLNEVKGGINGIKVEWVWADNRYEVPAMITIWERFKLEKPIMLLMYDSSGGHEALKASLERDKCPGLSLAMSGPQFTPPGWIYADSCSYGDQIGAFLEWVKPKPKKLGWMGWDSPYGRAEFKEVTAFAKNLGIEVLPIEYVPLIPVDTTPQLIRLRDAGAEYIWHCDYTPTLDVILRDTDKLGLSGKIIHVINSNMPGCDQIDLSGKSAEGTIAVLPFYAPNHEANLPSDVEQNVVKIAEKYRARKDINHWYMRGWWHAQVAEEAIRLAMEKVGYEGLTGAAVKEQGLDQIKNFRSYALGKPVTVKPGDRRISPYVRVLQVKGGKVAALSDWLEAPWMLKP